MERGSFTPTPRKHPSRAKSVPPLQPQINKPITDAQKKCYCLTGKSKVDEQLLMLAITTLVDNLHDFTGARSSLKENTINLIIGPYLKILEEARPIFASILNGRANVTIYRKILTAIYNINGIDATVKPIYAEYFNNNNITEPELEWSSLEQLTDIKDNFEVIIGNKKALLDLTREHGNNEFLKKLRPIICRNDSFKDKQINFVVDVSTIGNEPFIDGESKICKGAANYFDDFHRPTNYHQDTKYMFKEIDVNVNIQDVISEKENCKLNHLALADFQINTKGDVHWKDKKGQSHKINIDNTNPNEFGVSSFSLIINYRKDNTAKGKDILRYFKGITGLDETLPSPEYGRHIFDFKRLMDSSQIMYTYFLNQVDKSTEKYIFVTHDNTAAEIAGLIGVPYIHTHINGSIRSISVHLGGNGPENTIPIETINTIKQQIWEKVSKACNMSVGKALGEITNDVANICPVEQIAMNNFITARRAAIDYNKLPINFIFRWILNRYKNFLKEAKGSLENYINKVNNLTQKSYDAFKQLKDTKQILNVNYTTESLNQEYEYIGKLIKSFNSLQKKCSVLDFYNAIQNDSGYIFSTLDFKMLIYCILKDYEKAHIQVDFDTTYYNGIVLKSGNEELNGVISLKNSLKRFFTKIDELYPPPDTLKTRKGGYLTKENEEELEKVLLVNTLFDSIEYKADLKAYYEAINSRKVGGDTRIIEAPSISAAAPQQRSVLVQTTDSDTVMTYDTDTPALPSPTGTHQSLSRTSSQTSSQSYSRPVSSSSKRPAVSLYKSDSKRYRPQSSSSSATSSGPMQIGGEKTHRFQFYEDFLNKLKM